MLLGGTTRRMKPSENVLYIFNPIENQMVRNRLQAKLLSKPVADPFNVARILDSERSISQQQKARVISLLENEYVGKGKNVRPNARRLNKTPSPKASMGYRPLSPGAGGSKPMKKVSVASKPRIPGPGGPGGPAKKKRSPGRPTVGALLKDPSAAGRFLDANPTARTKANAILKNVPSHLHASLLPHIVGKELKDGPVNTLDRAVDKAIDRKETRNALIKALQLKVPKKLEAHHRDLLKNVVIQAARGQYLGRNLNIKKVSDIRRNEQNAAQLSGIVNKYIREYTRLDTEEQKVLKNMRETKKKNPFNATLAGKASELNSIDSAKAIILEALEQDMGLGNKGVVNAKGRLVRAPSSKSAAYREAFNRGVEFIDDTRRRELNRALRGYKENKKNEMVKTMRQEGLREMMVEGRLNSPFNNNGTSLGSRTSSNATRSSGNNRQSYTRSSGARSAGAQSASQSITGSASRSATGSASKRPRSNNNLISIGNYSNVSSKSVPRAQPTSIAQMAIQRARNEVARMNQNTRRSPSPSIINLT